MSEANVEIIHRHCEIRHGNGGKRREVGMDDWGWEHPRPWIALVRRCRSVGCSASSTDRRADDRGRVTPHARGCAGSPPRRASGGALRTPARHAVDLAHEGDPLNVIQRQLGHATSTPSMLDAHP